MPFVYDPLTGLYTSADEPGQYFRYRFSTSEYERTDPPPAPANSPGPEALPEAEAPANAASPAAGFPKDAIALMQAYQALPTSERQRFWLFLNDGGEEFTLADLRVLHRRVNASGVDIRDRNAFEAFLKKQNAEPANGSERACILGAAQPANASERAYILGGSQPANGAADYEHRLIQANNGDPSVWWVQNGQRHGVPAPHVMRERFHAENVGGRWTNTLYVDPSEVSSIPMGSPVLSPYEGKLLQAGKIHENFGIALGAVLGPVAGIATAAANLVPADPTVWHIVDGKRQGIASEQVLRSRYGSTWEDGPLGVGHWTKVQLVDPTLINEFPIGPTETMAGNVGGASAGAGAGAPPG